MHIEGQKCGKGVHWTILTWKTWLRLLFSLSSFLLQSLFVTFRIPFRSAIKSKCIPELDRWIIKLIGVIAVAQMRSSTIDDYIKEGGSGYWLMVLVERPTLVRCVYGIQTTFGKSVRKTLVNADGVDNFVQLIVEKIFDTCRKFLSNSSSNNFS